MMGSRKTTYFIITGVAALALIVDRLCLSGGGPKTVAAAPTVENPAAIGRSDGTVAPHVVKPASQALPEVRFPREVQSCKGASAIPDIFATPKSMENLSAAQGDGANKHKASQAFVFQATHRLQALLRDAETTIAFVGGEMLKRGEDLDGCTFSDASESCAVFRCQDESVELCIAGDGRDRLRKSSAAPPTIESLQYRRSRAGAPAQTRP